MKYIPAENLKTEIERLYDIAREATYNGEIEGEMTAYDKILSLIPALQQEQPKPSNNLVDVDAVREDFIREVYRVLDADPTNDRANAIIDAFDSLPTVSQEKPELPQHDKKIIENIIHCLEYLQREDTERKYNGDHNADPEHYTVMIDKLKSFL